MSIKFMTLTFSFLTNFRIQISRKLLAIAWYKLFRNETSMDEIPNKIVNLLPINTCSKMCSSQVGTVPCKHTHTLLTFVFAKIRNKDYFKLLK
jgi:hypothetical protein